MLYSELAFLWGFFLTFVKDRLVRIDNLPILARSFATGNGQKLESCPQSRMSAVEHSAIIGMKFAVRFHIPYCH